MPCRVHERKRVTYDVVLNALSVPLHLCPRAAERVHFQQALRLLLAAEHVQPRRRARAQPV